jgi:hypothetical protein
VLILASNSRSFRLTERTATTLVKPFAHMQQVNDYLNANGTSSSHDAAGSAATRSDLSAGEAGNSSGGESPTDSSSETSAPTGTAAATAAAASDTGGSSGAAVAPTGTAEPAVLMRPRSFSQGFNSNGSTSSSSGGSGLAAGRSGSASSAAAARGRPYEAPFQVQSERLHSGVSGSRAGSGAESDAEHDHEALLAQMPDWESNMKDLVLPEGRAEREEEDDTEGTH